MPVKIYPAVALGMHATGQSSDELRLRLPFKGLEETSQLSQIGRKNMECVLPLTEHNQMNCTDSSLKTSS
ncbi:Protein Nynrin [Manis pentadactyla]|nr:Protein Nynrin [Manis pentadactyla]